jgi:hypothetical protein
MATPEERLEKAEDLERRVRGLRERLETVTDPDEVAEVLRELDELAKQTLEQIDDARRAAETDANA